MRSHCIIWVGTNPDATHPYVRTAEGGLNQREREGVRRWKRRLERPAWPRDAGPLGSGWSKAGVSLRGSRGSTALLPLGVQTSGLQNSGRINVYCLKIPGLWQFAVAAIGKEYR